MFGAFCDFKSFFTQGRTAMHPFFTLTSSVEKHLLNGTQLNFQGQLERKDEEKSLRPEYPSP